MGILLAMGTAGRAVATSGALQARKIRAPVTAGMRLRRPFFGARVGRWGGKPREGRIASFQGKLTVQTMARALAMPSPHVFARPSPLAMGRRRAARSAYVVASRAAGLPASYAEAVTQARGALRASREALQAEILTDSGVGAPLRMSRLLVEIPVPPPGGTK